MGSTAKAIMGVLRLSSVVFLASFTNPNTIHFCSLYFNCLFIGILIMAFILVAGLAFGSGTRYRFRGINPGSRNVLSSIDDQYRLANDYDKPYNS